MAQAIDLFGLGGFNLTFPSVTALQTSVGQAGVGVSGGVLFEQELSSSLAIELGGIFMTRNWGVEGLRETEKRFHLPLLFRYRIPEFDFFGGGYYSLGLGQIQANGLSEDYLSLQQSRSDWGATLGVGKVFADDSKKSFFIRILANIGFKDGSTTPLASLFYRDIQILGGMQLGSF